MSDEDDLTDLLGMRAAYMGLHATTPTADLLPTRTMPGGLIFPEYRVLAAAVLRRVRATYVACRRRDREQVSRRPNDYGERRLVRWDGGYDWRGRYHVPVWARIAAAAMARGIDVVDYVEWEYATIASAGTPFPNRLVSSDALDRYESDRMGRVQRQASTDQSVMLTHFDLELFRRKRFFGSGGDAAACGLLRSDGSYMSPLFRYWFASLIGPACPGTHEIRELFRLRAAFQYALSRRAYDACFDPPVPGEIQVAASWTTTTLAELVADEQERWLSPGDDSTGQSKPAPRRTIRPSDIPPEVGA